MGLIRRYSNQNILARLRQVLEQVESSPERKSTPADQPVRPYRIDRRLTPEQIAELVAAYEGGTSTPKLCEQYELSKGGILKLLAERNVPMRRQQHLTESQTDNAAEQYQAGDSLATIAKRIGSTATTVRRLLQARGVVMRPAGGTNPMSKRHRS